MFNLAFASMILAISNGGFNSVGGNCWLTSNERLPHCTGIESGEIRDGFTIPCGRGDGKKHPTLRLVLMIISFSVILQAPAVISVTMVLMYRTVYRVEKRMQNYGAGALRLREKLTGKHVDNNNGNAIDGNSPSAGSPPAPYDEVSGNHNRFSLIQWMKINQNKIPCIKSLCNSGPTVKGQDQIQWHRRHESFYTGLLDSILQLGVWPTFLLFYLPW